MTSCMACGAVLDDGKQHHPEQDCIPEIELRLQTMLEVEGLVPPMVGELKEQLSRALAERDKLGKAMHDDARIVAEMKTKCDHKTAFIDGLVEELGQVREMAGNDLLLLDEAQAEVKRLRKSLEDLYEDGCSYGDDCPPNTNHYKCKPCVVREALAEQGGG